MNDVRWEDLVDYSDDEEKSEDFDDCDEIAEPVYSFSCLGM